LETLLVETFALVKEWSKRTLGLTPFDVQLAAGIALFRGTIAEMQTGEGKTLAAVFPATLYGLTGKGVHILTFNDYLAARDTEWMRPIYEAMGLSVSSIREGMTYDARKRAWHADITYATAKEAGFDYLRDQLVLDTKQLVHRPFHVAIVDEADSILLDEARVPLVIAGATEEARKEPYKLAQLIDTLAPDTHYGTDEYKRVVYLTDEGQSFVEEQLGLGDLHREETRHLQAGIQVALHAKVLLHKDVDYIVRDGHIELVDAFTGRVVDDRQWPDGIQAALEAKEGLEVQPEGQILGSITLQHFMQQYPVKAGMTGTARPAEHEFFEMYQTPVVVIPPNRPCIREERNDRLFVDLAAKHRAILQELQRCQKSKQPVLVGTCSVEESETLSQRLRDADIPHHVLNAKTDAHEAAIIAEAGLPGAVTISTNMAGRGVDIKLGGADESQRDIVLQAGGLLVIGTNRHESIRIDYQLRGRAGRQGEPGASQFFVSLEDDLMKQYNVFDSLPHNLLLDKDAQELDNPVFRRAVQQTQRIIEGQNHTIRQTLFKYASFIESQRQVAHEYRKELLTKDDIVREWVQEHQSAFKHVQAVLSEQEQTEQTRHILLLHLDRCWAEHLATITSIREGIHLQSAGSLNPFVVFCQQATDAFESLFAQIDERTETTLRTSLVQDGKFVLNQEGLHRPSSTWTYLINDEVFDKGLATMLRNTGIGFAAGGFFLMIPIAFGYALWRKWTSRKR
jgi:preprotein translocase subunit SecA